MISVLPTEFFLPDRPGTIEQVEQACALATDNHLAKAVALAVDPVHVSRAAELLFGTGLGVISVFVTTDDSTRREATVRRSLAAGATEVAVMSPTPDWRTISNLQAILGSSAKLTVPVTDQHGNVDLAVAERALLEGVDYVSYTPASITHQGDQVARLLALAKEVGCGRIKLGEPRVGRYQDYRSFLAHDDWAFRDANVRLAVRIPGLIPGPAAR